MIRFARLPGGAIGFDSRLALLSFDVWSRGVSVSVHSFVSIVFVKSE
jgi:hypothetical protein